MENRLHFSNDDIVTIWHALCEAERVARAEVFAKKGPELAKLNLEFAEEFHALRERIFDQALRGESNG